MCMSAVLYITTKICDSAMICTGIKYGVITKKEKDAQKSTPLMTKNKRRIYIMLTYLKIGIMTDLICMVMFLGLILWLRVKNGKENTKEFLDFFDVKIVALDSLLTVFIWPVQIPAKLWIGYSIFKLKHQLNIRVLA